MLLTRSRLCPRPKPGSSLHLHVLGTPPAFVLSQDQTLREELLGERPKIAHPSQRVVRDYNPLQATTRSRLRGQNPGPVPGGIRPLRSHEGARRTQRAPERKTGSILAPSPDQSMRTEVATVIEPGHTSAEGRPRVRMLLSFQRPSHLFRRDFLRRHAREPKLLSGRTDEYSAEQRPRKNAPGSTSAPINRPHKIAGPATECRLPVVRGRCGRAFGPVGGAVGPARSGPLAALSGQQLRKRRLGMGWVSLRRRLSNHDFVTQRF